MQREAILHVLAVSLFIYLLARNLISENSAISRNGAILGGLTASISYTYGGYLSTYPILQVPLLESGTWLPLVLFGILKATRPAGPQIAWRLYLVGTSAKINS